MHHTHTHMYAPHTHTHTHMYAPHICMHQTYTRTHTHTHTHSIQFLTRAVSLGNTKLLSELALSPKFARSVV